MVTYIYIYIYIYLGGGEMSLFPSIFSAFHLYGEYYYRRTFGRLAVQGPKRGGRPATSWVDCLQKNLEAFGAIPRKGKGRKWVAFGVVVKDGRDWMTAAKNMDKWHRGVERGAEALDSAWRRADLRQSNVQLQR